jgi:hypothetical protein
MRAAWGGLGLVVLLAGSCGPAGLATQAVVADVGRGPLLVLVGTDALDARRWLDAATPGYRLVQVTAGGDLDGEAGPGPRVLVVPGRSQALGLALAGQDPRAVAGILFLADGTPVDDAWRSAVTAHGWKWRTIAPPLQAQPDRRWWQDWLPGRQAAFSVQPSPACPAPSGWPCRPQTPPPR